MNARVQLGRREVFAAVLFTNGFTVNEVATTFGVSVDTVKSLVAYTRRRYAAAGRIADSKIALQKCLAQDGYITATGTLVHPNREC